MGHFLGILSSVKVSFVEKRENGLKKHTVFVAEDEGTINEKTKSEYIEEEKYAGLYTVKGFGHKEITIVNDKTFYLIHFLSVLAHEVTHNYLYHHQVKIPEKIDSEELTDLATIFLGFGGTILRGYEPSSAISCRLGYIDVSTIRRAILHAYFYRDWNIKDITNEFKWIESHKYYFQLNLLPRSLLKIFFSSKSKSENNKIDDKLIILCDSCHQKLRVPKRTMSVKVTCPRCGFCFVIGKDGNKI